MLKNLLNLLFPKLCNGCNSLLLKNEAIICSTCRHGLPLTQHHNLKDNYTTKKFYGIIPVEFSASMLFFHKEGIVQNLIHNLKYRKQQEIGTFLGNWYAEDLKEIAKKDCKSAVTIRLQHFVKHFRKIFILIITTNYFSEIYILKRKPTRTKNNEMKSQNHFLMLLLLKQIMTNIFY